MTASFAHMTDATDTQDSQQRDALRASLQLARRQLTDAQIVERSQAIATTLKTLIEPSCKIAGYLALGNEVRLDSVLAYARSHHCETFVPIVQPENQMVFARINDDIALVKNRYGIHEPEWVPETCIAPHELDVVLVPLVGFDAQCQRMGMGGGYYDRAFAHKREHATRKPRLIGVAYEIQHTETVLPDWWDVPLDLVVTESRVIKRS